MVVIWKGGYEAAQGRGGQVMRPLSCRGGYKKCQSAKNNCLREGWTGDFHVERVGPSTTKVQFACNNNPPPPVVGCRRAGASFRQIGRSKNSKNASDPRSPRPCLLGIPAPETQSRGTTFSAVFKPKQLKCIVKEYGDRHQEVRLMWVDSDAHSFYHPSCSLLIDD